MTLISKTQQYSYSTGSYIRGRWVDTPPIVGTFEGSVQPITYKDVQSGAVGREDLGNLKIYSDIALPIGEEGGTTSGAVLEWQGKKWEITKGRTYDMGLIPHNKYIAELRGNI